MQDTDRHPHGVYPYNPFAAASFTVSCPHTSKRVQPQSSAQVPSAAPSMTGVLTLHRPRVWQNALGTPIPTVAGLACSRVWCICNVQSSVLYVESGDAQKSFSLLSERMPMSGERMPMSGECDVDRAHASRSACGWAQVVISPFSPHHTYLPHLRATSDITFTAFAQHM